MVGCGADIVGTDARGEGVAFRAIRCIYYAGDGGGTFTNSFKLCFAGGICRSAAVHALKPIEEVAEADIVCVGGEANFVM